MTCKKLRQNTLIFKWDLLNKIRENNKDWIIIGDDEDMCFKVIFDEREKVGVSICMDEVCKNINVVPVKNYMLDFSKSVDLSSENLEEIFIFLQKVNDQSARY